MPRYESVRCRAYVERGDALQVFEQIGAKRRVHVHASRHAGIHLLLDEPRMEVPGVEGHQAYFKQGAAAFLPRCRAPGQRGRGQQHGESRCHARILRRVGAGLGFRI